MLDVVLNNVFISFFRTKDKKTAHTIVCRNIIKKKLEEFICPSTKRLRNTVFKVILEKKVGVDSRQDKRGHEI